jgi:hypothetical protein
MRAMRGQLVSRVNSQCRELLVPELLKLDCDGLNTMMGWHPSAQDKFGKWASLDIEVLHRTTVLDDGDSDWCGEHSFEKIFRSQYIFRVRFSFNLVQNVLTGARSQLRSSTGHPD